MGRRDIAKEMRARAREVRHDGSFGGLFEITVWCSLRKVHVLLAFGVTILNVYVFCGGGLSQFKTTNTPTTVAVQVVHDKLMSADKPDVIVPAVNHFVIGRSDHARQGLETSDGATAARYLPDGGRRTAVAVARDLAWRIVLTACQGDCLMDCFAYFSCKPRDAIHWK